MSTHTHTPNIWPYLNTVCLHQSGLLHACKGKVEAEGKRGEQASGAEGERTVVCLVINSSADLTGEEGWSLWKLPVKSAMEAGDV